MRNFLKFSLEYIRVHMQSIKRKVCTVKCEMVELEQNISLTKKISYNFTIKNSKETLHNYHLHRCRHKNVFIKPGFHYTANAMTTTQKQSDYKVEQSSFTLIALF